MSTDCLTYQYLTDGVDVDITMMLAYHFGQQKLKKGNRLTNVAKSGHPPVNGRQVDTRNTADMTTSFRC